MLNIWKKKKKKGVIAQYSANVSRMYGDFRNPESEKHLLLWRELPYTYRLNNGKTIARGWLFFSHCPTQWFWLSRFQRLDIRESVVEAVRQAQQLISLWQSIQSQVDAFRFQYTMDGLQFELQELETQRHKVHKAFKHLDSSTQALSSLL